MINMSTESNKPRFYRRSGGQLKTGSLEPIVLEYQSRKKKGKSEEEGEKYSKGLEDVQQAETDLIRVARRASKAVAKGLETYDQERSRSAEEKKDGAIEDFPHNAAKAASETLKEASEIPVDMADSMSTKNYRKRLRQNLKSVSKALRLFRI
jgi:hypothetical protein